MATEYHVIVSALTPEAFAGKVQASFSRIASDPKLSHLVLGHKGQGVGEQYVIKAKLFLEMQDKLERSKVLFSFFAVTDGKMKILASNVYPNTDEYNKALRELVFRSKERK